LGWIWPSTFSGFTAQLLPSVTGWTAVTAPEGFRDSGERPVLPEFLAPITKLESNWVSAELWSKYHQPMTMRRCQLCSPEAGIA